MLFAEATVKQAQSSRSIAIETLEKEYNHEPLRRRLAEITPCFTDREILRADLREFTTLGFPDETLTPILGDYRFWIPLDAFDGTWQLFPGYAFKGIHGSGKVE